MEYMITLSDGSQVDLGATVADATQEQVKATLSEAGLSFDSEGKVDLSSLAPQVQSEYQEQKLREDFVSSYLTARMIRERALHRDGGRFTDRDVEARYKNLTSSLENTARKLAVNTGVSETGDFGNTVPTVVADSIKQVRDKETVFTPRTETIRNRLNFEMPVEDSVVEVFWTKEGNSQTQSNPTTEGVMLKGKTIAGNVFINYELIDSTPIDVANYLMRRMSRKLAEKQEEAFINGDGDGQPTGFRDYIGDDDLEEIDLAGDPLTYDDLIKLTVETIPEEYQRSAMLLTSKAGKGFIKRLKDSNGMPIYPAGDTLEEVEGYEFAITGDIPADLGSDNDETEIWLVTPEDYMVKYSDNMRMERVLSETESGVTMKVSEAVDGNVLDLRGYAVLKNVAKPS